MLNIGNEELILMKPIPGFTKIIPNSYYLTSTGRIFSTVFNKLNELSPSFTTDGYKMISLINSDGSRTTYRINRLVCLYFNGVPESPKYEVDHIDGIKTNNHYSNLRWVTHKQNMEYAIQNNLFKRDLTEKDIIAIKRLIVEEVPLVEIARQFGVNPSTITQIKTGKIYTDIKTEYDDKITINHRNYINRETVLNIYNEYEKNPNIFDKDVASKYNVSINTVMKIRNAQFPYSNILAGKAPIEKSTVKQRIFSDEQAIAIYNDCQKMSVPEVAKKYNCGVSLIFDIKLVRNCYANLATDYGLKPIDTNVKIPEEVALKAYDMLYNGASNKDVQQTLNLGESTVTDIKFCRKSFSYLTTKYNKQSLQVRR